MIILYCGICGIKFISNKKNKLWCSERCYKEKIKRYKHNYYKNNIEKITNQHKEYYEQYKKEISEQHVEYRNNHKKEYKEYFKNYYQSYKIEIDENHKKYYKKYIVNIKNYQGEYYKTHKNELNKYKKEYYKTNKGKESIKRTKNKRKRNFGFNPLNEYFNNSEAHHINTIDVIYIPINYHFKGHSVLKNKNMEPINTVAFFFLVMQNIDKFRYL